jgi:hypothetical protein
MQPIQSLVDEAARLSKSFHAWNNVYMYLVFATAVFVALTFIAQWKAKTQAEAMEEANNAVIRAKDGQLKEEFAHRDERIAQVKADADVQIARVQADAKTEAKRIETEASSKIADAKTEAGRANEQAGHANERAGVLELEAANLKKKNLETEKRLEAERIRRVPLQRSVFHRMIPQIGVGDKMNWDSLKPFKGVNVSFQYSPGKEPAMFVGNLGAFPMNAGWNFLGSEVAEKDDIPEGVTVFGYVGPKGETDRSMDAAKAFAEFMANHGIEEVRFGPSKPGRLKPDTVLVLIGQMPDPFKNLE